SANRVGTERGTTFLGRSKVIDPLGARVVEASGDREELLYAWIKPAITRDKHLVSDPGQDEMHLFKDRRPELYGAIVDLRG
ncbi:MAG: nitrilase-related carbon-nitrogen hydrolase, partial [Chloroflexota bacterium]